MSEREIGNNKVTVIGKIVSNFSFSHEVFGEGFYVANLHTERTSGNSDIVPIMVSERLFDVKADWKFQYVKINGQFRSYNKHDESGNHLILSVFAREFLVWEDDGETIPDYENYIFLDGYICKKPIYRKTPNGREITDILLAVNRPYGKSDYIPCICWGRNARFAGTFETGFHVYIGGRIQSREYQKRIGEDEFETRVAYEVSVSKINIVKKTEGEENVEEK